MCNERRANLSTDDSNLRQLDVLRADSAEHVVQLVDHRNQCLHRSVLVGGYRSVRVGGWVIADR